MDMRKLNDWLQVVGMFGVIASLVFVGLQMKQAQEIALSEAYTARTAIDVAAKAAMVDGTTILSAMSKVYANRADALTSQEMIALEYRLAQSAGMWENNHFQHQAGFLSDEHWQRNLDEMICEFSLPLYRTLILEWTYRESFMEVMRDAIAKAEANPTCWKYDWEWDYPIG